MLRTGGAIGGQPGSFVSGLSPHPHCGTCLIQRWPRGFADQPRNDSEAQVAPLLPTSRSPDCAQKHITSQASVTSTPFTYLPITLYNTEWALVYSEQPVHIVWLKCESLVAVSIAAILVSHLQVVMENVCFRRFPGGPVLRTLHFHCQGPGFNPWLEN